MRPSDPADILLIEDNPDDTAFFMHAAAQAGATTRIHVVLDGAAALAFIIGDTENSRTQTHGVPRLIVLDLKLPKVSGFKVLRTLKSDPRTRYIPVVVLSSSTENRDLFAGYDLGANGFVQKPVDFEQYGECVRSLIRYWIQFNRVPQS